MSKQQPTTTTKATKTSSITLRSGTAILMLLATRKDDGGAVTTVTQKDGPDAKTQRGMTETHKTFEIARAHLETLAKQAEKLGWKRGVFAPVAKPNAFSALPAPKTDA